MSNVKVLVSDKLSEHGLKVLRDTAGVDVDYQPGLSPEDLLETIGEYHGLLIRSATKVTEAVIAKADQLKVIGRAGIGVDNIDIPAASKRGIVVMNTPTGNAVTTAEHALSLLMATARHIPRANASMHEGKWEKSKFKGAELWGKTLGVIGLGNIGRIVADRAQGLKMKVVGSDPVIDPAVAEEIGVELVDLDELLARADFISLHTPLVPSTRGLFNDDNFNKCKDGLILVNAARGGIVDEEALKRAIASGKVARAALDVFPQEPIPADHPLIGVPEVTLTPHLGASTAEAQDRVAVEIAEQAAAYLLRGEITNALNTTCLSGEAAEALQPHIEVGRRLGELLAQLDGGEGTDIRITCAGAAAAAGATPVANAVVGGFLSRRTGAEVGPMSAPHEAQARGLSVTTVQESGSTGRSSWIRVTVSGGDELHTATGALSRSGEAHLTGLGGFEVDTWLRGTILMMRNTDLPGVIGAVGSALGQREINVSRVTVSPDAESGEALALWCVEGNIPDDLVTELQALDHLKSVTRLTL